MAKREGLLDVLIAIATKLPWWLSLVLAAASYAGLHYIAVADTPTPTTMKAIGEIVIRAGTKTVASIFQYVLPIAFIVGAVLSVSGKSKRNLLHSRAAAEGLRAIATMTWSEFEMLISEVFRRRGLRVTERRGQAADRGVDLVLGKQGERHIVQCKHWRAAKVSVAAVRKLYGVMAAEGAAGGFVVTAGDFTKDAQDFAMGRNIELINGAALAAMVHEASKTVHVTRAADVPGPAISSLDVQHGVAPLCPRCGKSMVKRIARQGANARNEFWGCSGFPGCRGIRSAA